MLEGDSMKFEFEILDGKTIIRPIFEATDSTVGKREEGPGTEITYSGEEIFFDYAPRNIHPDHIALICTTIFYPFIGESVTFPKAVSNSFVEAFSNPCFSRKFEIKNVDESLEPHKGEKIALSFGGGVDSSAVRRIYPEAIIVHEGHIKNGNVVPSHSHEIVKSLENGKLIMTNQRYVSTPGGWHSWPCSTLTTVLMASDEDIGLILTGTILGATFLQSGIKYWDRFRASSWHGPTGNFWSSAFRLVGVPLFSPVGGSSEFLTMQAALPLIEQNQVVYCMEKDGGACRKCTKCLRRELIRTVIDSQFEPKWDTFDSPSIHAFLEKRPMFMGHIYSYAYSTHSESLPTWMTSRIQDLQKINTDWPMKQLDQSFEFVDEKWRNDLLKKINDFYPSMTIEEFNEMKSWGE
tara:strand:+ start:371 stop:1591 length:1221 start_codon:yes stop_codon:yes gene_type:complete